MFWLRRQQTTETSALFDGESGHRYSFFSVAYDNVGFREDEPLTPDTSMTVGQTLALVITSIRMEGGTVSIRFTHSESQAGTLDLETARSLESGLNPWQRDDKAVIARVALDTFEATTSTGGDAIRFYRLVSRAAPAER